MGEAGSSKRRGTPLQTLNNAEPADVTWTQFGGHKFANDTVVHIGWVAHLLSVRLGVPVAQYCAADIGFIRLLQFSFVIAADVPFPAVLSFCKRSASLDEFPPPVQFTMVSA